MKEVTKACPQDRNSFSYKIKNLFKRNWAGWLIMLPGILLFVFYLWGPLVQNVVWSFYDMRGTEKTEFVWFQNYVEVVQDPMFLKALGNTFKYLFWSIVIGFLVPIFLGLLLSETVHFKGGFRLLLYFPSMISGIAVAIMWYYILDSGAGSMLNTFLASLGLPSSLFLSDESLVIPLIVVTMTWKSAGATVLIYLSALQNIDNSQYEAARMDGANMWKRIWHITLPHLKSTIRMLFILQVISVFQVFYEPLVMTDGGPNGASISLLLLGYQYAFGSNIDLGKSGAVSVMLSLIIIVLTIIYLRVSAPKKRRKKK